MWPFRKRKKLNSSIGECDKVAGKSSADISSLPPRSITFPLTYDIRRVDNGYQLNAYLPGSQGNGKEINRIFGNQKQVVKYLAKQLNELEREIEMLKFKQ